MKFSFNAKRFAAAMASVFVLVFSSVYVSAADIYADTKTFAKGETQTIAVKIENNDGIMGFKLHFQYSESEVEICEIAHGTVTSVGNMQDNLGLHKGGFDVLWNYTQDVKGDGSLVLLTVKRISDKPFEISIGYSQPDTFNEAWEDVVLEIEGIKIPKVQDAPSSDRSSNTLTSATATSSPSSSVVEASSAATATLSQITSGSSSLLEESSANQNIQKEPVSDAQNNSVINESQQIDTQNTYLWAITAGGIIIVGILLLTLHTRRQVNEK